MKLVRGLLMAGLAISIVLNFVLWWRNDRRRPQLKVNNHTFSQREYHDWLEMHYGPVAQKNMALYYVFTDAAAKAGVAPSKEEVKKDVDDQIEANPELGMKIKREPWTRGDMENEIEWKLALFNVATKDVKPTEQELQSFYQSMGPATFDEPGKIETRLLVSPTKDMTSLNTAKEMVDAIAQRAKVESPAPGVQQKLLPDITQVQAQLQPKVMLLFGDGKRVFRSTEPDYAVVKNLKVGDSTLIPNKTFVKFLVYVEKRTDERKTTLNDPETKKRVLKAYKTSIAGGKLVNQKARDIWNQATVQTEPEALKADIERSIFGIQSSEQAGK